MKGKLIIGWAIPLGTYIEGRTQIIPVDDCSIKAGGEVDKRLSGLERESRCMSLCVLIREDLTHEELPIPERFK